MAPSELTLMIGQTVSHYRVLEKIGRGGMGTIYKAEDTRLGRPVAIKFLPREYSQDHQAVERFQREARAASALNHPHIYTIYDVGEHEGQPFIVMELLEGQPLKQRLDSPLDPEQVVELGIQIADALAAAHAKGIIHRDIKPANIFITERGQAKILDFGVAKLATQQNEEGPAADTPDGAGPGAQDDLTRVGMAVGTLGYMSPEQGLGKELDARTDIYSFGVVLYEMATGRPAILDDLGGRTPPSPRAARPGLSPDLERIIRKAAEKDRELRYQTMADVRADLKRLKQDTDAVRLGGALAQERIFPSGPRAHLFSLLTGGAFAAALLVVLWFFMMGWGQRPGGTDAGVIESLAVLPLQNLSGDPEEEYFADGMTEALITNLSKIGSLKVISRTSAMRYKGTDKSLPEIARELGVDAIVEGSVLRAGDRVRITAQLVDVATDQYLWAESYERDLGDVLELQREVARAVAAGIQITLTPEEQASLGTISAVDPTAYEAYLRGRYHWNMRTEEGIQKSLDYFQQAVAQDPDYASAYSGLADAYTIGMEYGYLPAGENRTRSRTAALRAVELDNSLPEAHASLAMVFASEREWLAGEREFRRALELNPNYAKARHWYSIHLAAMGRLEEALAEMEQAVALDPASLQAEVWLGTCLLYLRRYDEAIGQFEETIEKDPYYFNSHYWLGQAYEAKGWPEQAVAAYEKAASLSETPHQRATLAHGYAVAGRRAEARKILGELEELAEEKYVSPYDFAVVYLGLGDNDRAIELLEQVYEDHPENLRHIKVRPWFDPLRDHPRFQSLLQRMNFPEESGALTNR